MRRVLVLAVYCVGLFPAFVLGQLIGAHWSGYSAPPLVMAGEWVLGFAAWHAVASIIRQGREEADG